MLPPVDTWSISLLTHWGWATHICISKLIVMGSDNGLSAPSHYLNHCWNIVNWNLRNNLQWKIKRNSYILIEGNVFQNVVWKMVAILSQPQCVNWVYWGMPCVILPFINIQQAIKLSEQAFLWVHVENWDEKMSLPFNILLLQLTMDIWKITLLWNLIS